MNETKEHILKTSLLLFLQKSYRDVTMKEIVEKTGLSKGAFYHYFKSKDDLFKEIVHLFFGIGAVNYDAFNKQSLCGFYNDYLVHTARAMDTINKMFGQEKPKYSLNFFFLLFEAVGRFPEFLKLEKEMYQKDLDVWTKVVCYARKHGEISSEAADADISALFLYLTDGVFIRFVNSDKSLSYKEYLQKAFDSLYSGLKTGGFDSAQPPAYLKSKLKK